MSRWSPLRSVWFNPSRTIAQIAHENPGYRLFVLPILAGFAVLPTFALFSTGDTRAASGLVLSTLVAFGPFVELFQLFAGAYLIRLTGIWLGGKAGIASIQTAIAWGNVPIVALAVLGIASMIISEVHAELADVPLTFGQSHLVSGIGIFLLALQFAIIAWSIGIFLRGLATVQGYSTGRAIINSLFACALPAVLIIVLAVSLGYSDKLLWLFFAGLENLVVPGE